MLFSNKSSLCSITETILNAEMMVVDRVEPVMVVVVEVAEERHYTALFIPSRVSPQIEKQDR